MSRIFLESRVNQNRRLICVLCNTYFRNPVQINRRCGHVFCKACIIKYGLSRIFDKAHSLSPCPTCRIPFSLSEIIDVPLIGQLVADLKFDCPNKCNQSLDAGNIMNHLNVCPFQEVKCPNVNCGIKTFRFLLNSHRERCPYNDILCENCHMVFFAREFLGHLNRCGTSE